LALLSAVGSTAYLGYLIYVQVTQINPQYHNFPPEVATPLRRAVYYTDVDPNPSRAMTAYKEALIVADQLEMDPYSDEVLGIKLNISMMLEKAGLTKAAIEVLEKIKAESLTWVEEGRKRKLLRENERAGEKKVKSEDSEEAAQEEEKRLEKEQREDRQRDRTLKQIIGMGLKLGELYATEDTQNHAKAEAAMTSAIELCVREMHRRERLGLPVGGDREDSWMDLSEIAYTFDELAKFYTAKDKQELAIPLFMQALSMIKEVEGDTTTCKQVVLLNNIASSMAEQLQKPSPFSSSSSAQNPLPRDQIIDSARQWAQKAIEVADRIEPPIRDEECDISCSVATYNLGSIAEMQGDFERARKKFEEARDMARKLGFEEGVTNSDRAIKRVS
jgi:tetratricopeptide (TPR) repeat protein